ncbi:glutaredoxin-C9-like [Punica granatum]|uniref:Glutaredoxin domain-containing protein n=2 Tax=Punica granatum TaxID=22663 RepID=A0A218VUW1_PUNGR|nr:glutaredoxin-C9-like [Punica granatum]OWM64337.1 hypothetical protein CDL15_Pgr010128 [Punica granatum]PKI56650.1 hypothetical protein CRG98_022962 [Punica granatum]
MQQAISYKSWLPIHTADTINRSAISRTSSGQSNAGDEPVKGSAEDVREVVRENAVIVFGRRGCCMTHVVKRLLLGLGVNPPVHEVDEKDEVRTVEELQGIGGGGDGRVQFPAVFIGGRLFGGLDRVMATHITGELVPILKEAGALWL